MGRVTTFTRKSHVFQKCFCIRSIRLSTVLCFCMSLQDPQSSGCGGNLLLDCVVGAKLKFVPPKPDIGVVDYESLYKMMEEYADQLS